MKKILISVLFSWFYLPLGAHAEAKEITVSLTARDQYSVIDLHNRIRCQVTKAAKSMPKVTWNSLLYVVAQNHANNCVFAHNSNRSKEYQALGGSGYVGENIFAIGPTGPNLYLASAIKSFASEKVNFSYQPTCASGICGCANISKCGHYTQQIWASSNTVACAQSDCRNTSIGGQFIVCDYAPGGNYVGSAPYTSSPKLVDTEACVKARIIPFKFLATPTVSSNASQIANILDGNTTSYWMPLSTDEKPFISLTLQQALNISHFYIQWSDLQHAAKTIQIQYSTEASGKNLITLPTRVLPLTKKPFIALGKTKVRYLKINFLENYDQPIRVSDIVGVDPSYSWNW